MKLRRRNRGLRPREAPDNAGGCMWAVFLLPPSARPPAEASASNTAVSVNVAIDGREIARVITKGKK